MTEDELDRALFALPLEEPPADLRRRILAATVFRPAPTFRAWELWLLAGALALAGLLTFWMLGSGPFTGIRLTDAIDAAMRSAGLFSRSTYVWIAIGASSVWWISSLSFMPARRLTVYNR
jgi:hypothetical protein